METRPDLRTCVCRVDILSNLWLNYARKTAETYKPETYPVGWIFHNRTGYIQWEFKLNISNRALVHDAAPRDKAIVDVW